MTAEQEQRAIALAAAGQTSTAIAAALRLPLGPVAAFLRSAAARVAIQEVRGNPLREAADYLGSIVKRCQEIVYQIAENPDTPDTVKLNACRHVTGAALDTQKYSDHDARIERLEEIAAELEAERKKRLAAADDSDPDDTALYTPEKP